MWTALAPQRGFHRRKRRLVRLTPIDGVGYSHQRHGRQRRRRPGNPRRRRPGGLTFTGTGSDPTAYKINTGTGDLTADAGTNDAVAVRWDGGIPIGCCTSLILRATCQPQRAATGPEIEGGAPATLVFRPRIAPSIDRHRRPWCQHPRSGRPSGVDFVGCWDRNPCR